MRYTIHIGLAVVEATKSMFSRLVQDSPADDRNKQTNPNQEEGEIDWSNRFAGCW